MLRVKRSQNPDAAAAANSVIVLSIEGEIWCVSICTAGCYYCELNWSQLEREGGRESWHHTHGLCTALSKHGINHTQQFITNHFNTHGERCNWSRFACVYFFPSHRLNDAIDIVSAHKLAGCWYYLNAIHITKTIDRLTNDYAHSENCTSFIAHYHFDRL